MLIELKIIDKTNYKECIRLKVSDEQKKFVATNTYSLVQVAYEPDMYPLGIFLDYKMVGFILYDFDKEVNGWSMSRFMIDKNHQNKGIGEKALIKFLELFKMKYRNQPLYTSAEVDNLVAIKLYEKYGFIKKEEFEYTYDDTTYREVRMLKESWV